MMTIIRWQVLWERENADAGTWDLECAGCNIKQRWGRGLGSPLGRGHLSQDLNQKRGRGVPLAGFGVVPSSHPHSNPISLPLMCLFCS